MLFIFCLEKEMALIISLSCSLIAVNVLCVGFCCVTRKAQSEDMVSCLGNDYFRPLSQPKFLLGLAFLLYYTIVSGSNTFAMSLAWKHRQTFSFITVIKTVLPEARAVTGAWRDAEWGRQGQSMSSELLLNWGLRPVLSALVPLPLAFSCHQVGNLLRFEKMGGSSNILLS